MLTFGKIPPLVVLMFAVCAAALPALAGDSALTVALDVPSPLRIGGTYQAELRVRNQSAVADAYVKISLPYALKVISGETSYRGRLDASRELVLRATFEVTGMATGVITGRALLYHGQSVFGKGQVLHCRAADGGIVVSDNSPEAEEDLRLEAEIQESNVLNRASLAKRRLRRNAERSIVKEDAAGPKYRSPLLASEAVPENTSLTALLDAGQSKVYRFAGHRGDRIWVTARSEELDPRLVLLRSDGTAVAEDDDGAGMLNARIPAQGVFELSSDDTYFVAVYEHTGSTGHVRLEIQDLTHLQPAPGAVLPAKTPLPHSAGAFAAETTLMGKIVYNLPDGGTAPVRLALVKLFVDIPLASDLELSSSQTDVNGEVSFRVPQANLRDTLYLQVFTRDAGFKIASVEDPFPLIGGVHLAESSRFTLPAAATVTFGIWNVAGAGQNGPFLVFDAAVEGYLIATQIARVDPPLIRVYFPVRNLLSLIAKPGDIDAHYNPATREIFLADLYGDSPDVVLHEYGHFLADVAGFWGPAGGDHEWPFTQRIPPALAWNEGWATFFAVAGQNAHGKPNKTAFVSRHPNNTMNYSLEDGHNRAVIDDRAAGDDNEGSVQFVLWDLYDDLRDFLPVANTIDQVSLWSREQQSLLLVRRALLPPGSRALIYMAGGAAAFADIFDLERFYDGLFQQFAFTTEQSAAIRAVFLDQGIRWESPPSPPTNLRFVLTAGGPQLEWQPGSANTAAYVVERKLPGQAGFTVVATPTGAPYPVPNVTVGTSFRVTGVSFNVARFTAPLFSAPSQEIMYTASPPLANPVIAVWPAQLQFAWTVGSPPPASQTVTITNSGGGTLSWTAASSAEWLRISPSFGTAPSTLSVAVNPANLAVGTSSGTITISSPGIASQAISVTLRVSAALPSIISVVNAASFRPGIVPGGLATLFGTNLSLTAGTEFPGGTTFYRGVTVSVEGHKVPLLALSNVGGQEQINFQVPFELGTPAWARVEVNSGGRTAALQNVPVVRVQPGIFEYTPVGSQITHAAALKADGSVVGPTNPVSPGDAVSIYLTGMGPVLPMLQTGQLGPADPPAVTYLEPVVRVAGKEATVLFSGYAPGFLGLYQINVVIPDTTPSGLANFDVVVDGVPSQTSKIAVR
jgi:uncharacterized protein (TIGR03437 family)